MMTSNITSCEILECVTQEFTSIVEDLWNKFSKFVNISKAWWIKECNRDLAMYQNSRSLTVRDVKPEY